MTLPTWRRSAPLLLTLTLAACAAPPPPPGVVPSAGPTAAPGERPASAAPASATPSGAATASPVPTATPAGPALPSLATGSLLRRYDFKGLGGLHYDRAGDVLHVIDAVNDDVTPRRYLLRRFKRDGTFEVAVGLGLEDEQAPDAVDGYAFGAFGTPFYTYREDERLVLRRLYTATPRDAEDFPSYRTARAGVAALRAEGTVLTMALLRLDAEEKAARTTNKRDIVYVQADPERDPLAVFQVPDPFVPTRRLALAPGGALYLLGATRGGTLGAKRLDATQQLTDVALGLTRMPDLVTFDAAGRLWLAYNSTGAEPATVAVHDPTGALLRSQPVTLADGARVYDVRGLVFDRAGVPLLAGSAIYADLRRVHGIFEFKPAS
ncbi:MAG: hypothetical protein VKQ33_03285 [Candidatus Sericytochromatia bacterium]|nr:hypothetical protein [Candidatus Sericytochromatia bacterium]